MCSVGKHIACGFPLAFASSLSLGEGWQRLHAALLLGLGADEHGHPSVWDAGCDAHGTDLRLEFRRGQR